MPLTFQITVLSSLFFTVAVNVLLRPTRTVALVGEIVMVTGAGAVIAT